MWISNITMIKGTTAVIPLVLEMTLQAKIRK